MTMELSAGPALRPIDSISRRARPRRLLLRLVVGTALVTTGLIGGVGVGPGAGVPAASAATNHDSLGTDFWLAFPTNSTFVPSLSLFISGATATSGSVDVPGLAFTSPFSVTPGTVTTVALPAGAMISSVDLVESLGIHVTATSEVAVYGLNRIGGSTDAYLGLPTDVLGTDYIVLAYSGNLGAEFAVVASQDATTVTITPSVAAGAHPAGVPYDLTLDQGQTYQLHNATELTGSFVAADKPIAVFAGNKCAVITVGNCDHVVEQMTPTHTWGTSFVTVPLATRSFDTFRYLARDDDTTVTVNGVEVATLDRGQFFEELLFGASTITSDKPILVAQYARSGTGLSMTNGDPLEVLVTPSDQFLASYTVATPASGFGKNYINVVAPTASVGSIVLDGSAVPAASFTAIPGSTFSGAQLLVAVGSHTITGSAPFGITVYGFGGFDSYGYPGGISFPSVTPVVTTLTLSPETASNPVTTQHCVTATVFDQNSSPMAGESVAFTVTGVNPTSGSNDTIADGTASFCYTGANSGDDSIAASVGAVSDTATNEWTWSPEVTSVALAPKDATSEINTQHCVTATVKDQSNAAMAGVSVAFTVTGSNPTSGSASTAADGTATLCYTGTSTGDDSILAEAGTISDTATKEWTFTPEVTTLTLAPKTATNPVNTEHCVIGTLRDQVGSPMSGVDVAFIVNGVNPNSGSALTDGGGAATYCYTGANAGDDAIEASVGSVSDTASSAWTWTPEVTSVTLAPKDATNAINTQHCVTATVKDQVTNPMAGVSVAFTVTGANPTSGTANSEANGTATFCYTGTTAGDDSILAAAGTISDTAAKHWTSDGTTISALGNAHAWLGLRNSQDQGTQFDLRAELLKNGVPVASGVKRCITGVTRAPATAKEAIVAWDFSPVTVASGDVLSVRFSARIGTNSNGTKCSGPGGSHNSAQGLRLYYDATSRNSRFSATIGTNPSSNLYLHSNGNACGNAESTGVTNRFLNSSPPGAVAAKCKDAGTVNFAGGNPWATVGTWSLAPRP